jgi:glycerate kinase
MGGSATVDGGTGILRALGIRFLDAKGKDITSLPEGLMGLASIDVSRLDPRLKRTELTVLCDVDNPLLGAEGAAAVFGPQKGAAGEVIMRLESALRQFSTIIEQQFGIDVCNLPKGGTAGGAAAGLYALLGARLVNGIESFLTATGFEEVVKRADWVITGEGSIDGQTLKGKGPHGVAVAAKRNGRQVIGLAGCLPQPEDAGLSAYFDVLLPINHELLPLPEALTQTAANLTATARAIGNLLAAGA